MLWPCVAVGLVPAEPDTEAGGSKDRAEAGGRDPDGLVPGLADSVVGDNGRVGAEHPVAVSDMLVTEGDVIRSAAAVERADMIDLAGVQPIAAAEGMDEAREDIGLVSQRLVEEGMHSGYLLAGGGNAGAHSLEYSPVVGGMQDVKDLPSVP